MTTLQRFAPNDENEAKVISVAMPTLEALGAARDAFYLDADISYGLGEALYDLDRDPMSGVITRDVYLRSFPAIHQLFTRPGTFEFYLTVFRAIWGDDVDIQFAVPQPGVLTINADTLDVEQFNLQAREVVNNAYVYHQVVTTPAGDNVMVQDTVGIKTQNEIQALMNELTPAGIFVTTTLTL